MILRVGCCGFPVNCREYEARLKVVEIQQTFYQPVRVETARRWREEAGKLHLNEVYQRH